ncbi:MarR family winged helix-turn-helix transcriptional regulator [Cupriavidus basilensis]|uniref:MarR family winged helix-turn-helix transcriptional regulator n=1 Tax=Cupriavidus basilensis TaxID=68895 RepID=UPI00157AF248|nr:MarR family transcriptional regulator [Cupriavidus basilensis]NUA29570.1 MarR family transcriptional regulator [Cupriavidus basilensis]
MHSNHKQDDPQVARASALATDLRIVIGQLRRRLREEVHPGDLTWAQMSVLGRLERDGPATVTTLARAEGVRSQSMGATVAVLEAARLVSGASDPVDGRQTILSLTADAREMILATRAAREDWLLRAIRTKLAATEQEELAAGIALLKRLADS